MKRMRLGVVIAILLLVVSIAIPIGPLLAVESVVQPVLAYAGIDVSNTPLTADMMMMYDSRYRRSMYRSRLTVWYRRGPDDRIEVPWEELSFYGWRVPAILFIENYYWGLPTQGEVHALCRELERRRGKGTGFLVESDLPSEVASLVGLNRWFACR